MGAKLLHQRYGKERVRFLRVVREPGAHRILDVRAGISLEGDFDAAYHSDDNTAVVPTDTMKNTLTVLAHDDPGDSAEAYARRVAAHFLDAYAQVETVTLSLEETLWRRLTMEGTPHPHAFESAPGLATVHLEARRSGTTTLLSGLRGVGLLKTTGSGFSGFPRDAFTTLPDTDDRILATEAEFAWRFARIDGVDFAGVRARILAEIHRVFANEFSPSVQRTLLQMGEAALAVAPEIESIRLAMPNRHYLPLNLSAFDRPAAQDRCYLPTDEPHGQIEAEVGRD